MIRELVASSGLKLSKFCFLRTSVAMWVFLSLLATPSLKHLLGRGGCSTCSSMMRAGKLDSIVHSFVPEE